MLAGNRTVLVKVNLSTSKYSLSQDLPIHSQETWFLVGE
jgi:hypothetical protein